MTVQAITRSAEMSARDDRLVDELVADPDRFEFTTAIRVADAAGTLRLVSDPSTRLTFSPLAGVERRDGAVLIRSGVSGLVGALGALPPSYTQTVLEEERRRSRSLLAFLDIFGEPLLRLFVDACEKYRLPRLLRWRGLAEANGIVVALLALTGLRSPQLRARNVVGDDAVLRYAGFFATRTRNASALSAMLCAHTGLSVTTEQFHPRLVEVPESQQSALGGGRVPRLGVDAMAGSTVRDHAGGFRVVIGPVGYADYLSLEPGSPRLVALMDLVRLYVGQSFRFDVQVVLRKQDVPFCQLGDRTHPPRLGWNAWARFIPLQEDSRDAIVSAPG